MKDSHRKILAFYFEDDEQLQQEYRDILLSRYLEETHDDIDEALHLINYRLMEAESEQAYEECAIIIDLLNEFEYFSRR